MSFGERRELVGELGVRRRDRPVPHQQLALGGDDLVTDDLVGVRREWNRAGRPVGIEQ